MLRWMWGEDTITISMNTNTNTNTEGKVWNIWEWLGKDEERREDKIDGCYGGCEVRIQIQLQLIQIQIQIQIHRKRCEIFGNE